MVPALLVVSQLAMLDVQGTFGARSGCPACSAGYMCICVWRPGPRVMCYMFQQRLRE